MTAGTGQPGGAGGVPRGEPAVSAVAEDTADDPADAPADAPTGGGAGDITAGGDAGGATAGGLTALDGVDGAAGHAQAAAALAARILRDGAGDAALTAAGLLDPDLPLVVAVAVARERGRLGGFTGHPHPLALAAALGAGAHTLVAMGCSYAGQRLAFGRPLASLQVQRHLFASASVAARASCALTERAAAGGAPADVAAALPVAVSAAWQAAEAALQVHGGNGYSEDYPVSRWWCDIARVRATVQGTVAPG